MATFNRVVLMGNLTRDPQLRDAGTSGHKVCEMGIAVGEKAKDASGNPRDIPCFVDFEAWDRLGELCGQYLRKGSPVLVEGKLQMDSWEKDGQKRTKLKVRAMTVKFLSAAPAGQSQQVPAAPAGPVAAAAVSAPAQPVPPANPLAADPDDIPF